MSNELLFLDNIDDVLDVIADFPPEIKKACLKFISGSPGETKSFLFLLDEGWGLVIKLGYSGDEGIVLLRAKTGSQVLDMLTEVLEAAPQDQVKCVEEILNSTRYAFELMNRELAQRATKNLEHGEPLH